MHPNKLVLTLLTIFICSQDVFAGDQYISVNLKKCTGDTSVFKVESVSLSCNDGPCDWGSSATLSGNYTIGNENITQTPVVSASIWGVNLFNDTVDICDDGKVSNAEGDVCPDAASYEYIVETDIPGFSWLNPLMSWFSIGVSTTFDFGDASVTCELQAKVNESSSSYSTMLIGSVAIGSALIIFRMKNRRTVITRREFEMENERTAGYEPSTHFVEMTTKGGPIVTGGAMV
jgi:hypothetical protein